jgi:protein-S-isoprenylcysteine O-methyltransferase Ste14
MPTTAPSKDARTGPTMGGVASFGYGLACYSAFLVVSLYAIGFLADVVVPTSVDRGGPRSGTAVAVVADAALLAVFALQHSVMARPAFKRRWTRLVPAHAERSTYVLLTSAALALVFWQWHPIPAVVWDVPGDFLRALTWALFALGWAWVVAMTFAIDHLDFLGLGRSARHLRGLPEQPPSFALPAPYRLVRHPMMLGFFVAFFAAPTMTAGHLLFAGLGCAYILVGVRLEERDLSRELPEYDAYAAVTGRFVPVRATPPSEPASTADTSTPSTRHSNH